MLKENSTPVRGKSALERRVTMGLEDKQRTEHDVDIDVEEFMVDYDVEVGDEELDEE